MSYYKHAVFCIEGPQEFKRKNLGEGKTMLYIGFGIRHWVKPLLVGSAAILSLGMTCESGKKAARIMFAAAKGAVKSAREEAENISGQPRPFNSRA